MDRLGAATELFEGIARDGVPHFPANVNIAGAFDGRHRVRSHAPESGGGPALKFNTHFIVIKGRTGRHRHQAESVAVPENPRTSMLACFRLAAIHANWSCSARYGLTALARVRNTSRSKRCTSCSF
jgi:predicted dinucleotide-utilizing enzyme